MAADEAHAVRQQVVRPAQDGRLGAARVHDQRMGRQERRDLLEQRLHRADGGRDDDQVGVGERISQRRSTVDGLDALRPTQVLA